jgi:Cys-tRNA(Pro) deacylase
MSKEKSPVTQAVRVLRQHDVPFSEHVYTYVDRGGTAEGARQLGLPEHALVKTLIMEDDARRPMIVLMHGDLEVSTKQLARFLGVKSVAPCEPETAQRHSGYMVGGTSPFGTKKVMPVMMEETILDLPTIYINGGKRGYLVGIDPRECMRVLTPRMVRVGIR